MTIVTFYPQPLWVEGHDHGPDVEDSGQVRSAGGVAPLESMLRDWHARLSARSRAMLTGAAALDAYLDCRPDVRDHPRPEGRAGGGR